jgi:hypothetical protein|tara:strand:+ start:931 stop:1524 length:594 start_codon:yes stop_codon:yes gene_type:complete
MNPNKIRKVYAPYSTTGEQVGQTPLEGYVDVSQAIYPAVNTGQIGEDGEWSGVVVSDKNFIAITKHEGIANGGDTLSPDTNEFPSLDMTGFNDLIIAMKPSSAGNYKIIAVMGPDTVPFANLTPVASGVNLRGNSFPASVDDIAQLLNQSTEAYDVADAWTLLYIHSRLKGQKNLQIQITNNTGNPSNMEVAFMRMV